ncbi:MAG: MarR family winged helix-turn-helix transcriptional regulator [Fusobacteriaceae bacterium]
MKMSNVDRVNEVLENFYKLFYKTEDMALKIGIKGLTHTELHIIDAIGEESLTMHELSERLGITMGTATVAVGKLSEKNFIIRTRSDVDRRKVYVNLDKKGKEALEYHENYHNMLLSSLTEKIPSEELEKFIKTFEGILENLNKKTEFFTPLPLDEFPKKSRISIVAVKGTPIIQNYFAQNGIKNFTVVEILKTGKEIEILIDNDKKIVLDQLDAKNLIGTKL